MKRIWLIGILVLMFAVTGCQEKEQQRIASKQQETIKETEKTTARQTVRDEENEDPVEKTETEKGEDLKDNGKSSQNSKKSVSGESKQSTQESSYKDKSVKTGSSEASVQKSSQAVSTEGSKQPSQTASETASKESAQTTEKSPETHIHTWNPVTTVVHHEEKGHMETYVIQDAYTETITEMVYDPWECCNICGYDCTGDGGAHMKAHALAGEGGGRHTEYYKEVEKKVYHEAQYEERWVVDQAAWDETVTTGYQCSCGATK